MENILVVMLIVFAASVLKKSAGKEKTIGNKKIKKKKNIEENDYYGSQTEYAVESQGIVGPQGSGSAPDTTIKDAIVATVTTDNTFSLLYDDLQKNIIVAEVLGAPKSKRFFRH